MCIDLLLRGICKLGLFFSSRQKLQKRFGLRNDQPFNSKTSGVQEISMSCLMLWAENLNISWKILKNIDHGIFSVLFNVKNFFLVVFCVSDILYALVGI